MRLLAHLSSLRPFSTVVRRSGVSQATDSENHYRLQGIYPYFLPIQTRWQDNDQYGHVNNIVYHQYFDTLICYYLIRYCGLNANRQTSSVVGFIVNCQCTFHTALTFPQNPLAALGVERVGRSSVCYRLALFKPRRGRASLPLDYDLLAEGCHTSSPLLEGFENMACTTGITTQVFVDPVTEKPKELPGHLREQFEIIQMKPRASC
ncbi:uncharacterized protein LOC129705620 [Leucoraja erinacea]|uniref:uncharacterized protein LOC129705620 n=1 Tax=Leucoraja erinaceus TaxID=7782 RepID=UPI00245889F6|nr:uncharacterized protein LOC129705620 [Leucoraja erinacea]XP_055505225.1 uncharacterized protein LOC129705620 [Leucoraja erinacea]XP_055505226.1 uncharacterized protein LOC129705620 [Leucoraja erinacea]